MAISKLAIFNTILIIILTGIILYFHLSILKNIDIDILDSSGMLYKSIKITPSSVVFNKDIELSKNLKLGENGKYTLTVDENKNLTLKRNDTSLLKFVDVSKDNDNYVDTKLCFNDDCSKFLNINKLYGITTNQSLTKI